MEGQREPDLVFPRRTDKTRADEHAEGADASGSPPQQEPQVVVGDDHELKRNEIDVGDENVGPSVTVDQNRLDWKSTVSSSAKFLLRGVRDSADAFGPLKSVAGGLCFFLENYEVRPPPLPPPTMLTGAQQTKANKQAIESLVPRVGELAALLCEPVPEGDFKERERRNMLER